MLNLDLNTLPYVGTAIPYHVARELNPQLLSALFKEVLYQIFLEEAEKTRVVSDKPLADRLPQKTRALENLTSSSLVRSLRLNAHPDTYDYIVSTALPALIDAGVKFANESLLFDTTKPVDIGGSGDFEPPKVLPYAVGVAPKAPTPCPNPPSAEESPKNEDTGSHSCLA